MRRTSGNKPRTSHLIIATLVSLSPLILTATAHADDTTEESAETIRVSVSSQGEQAHSESWSPAISSDGRLVAFASPASNLVPNDNNGTWDVFIHDRTQGSTERVSVSTDGDEGNDGSYAPVLSSNGRYVAFHSYASNLALGDINGLGDVFLHDRSTNLTTLISATAESFSGNGWSGLPSISYDGRFIAFESLASDLIESDSNGASDIFVSDQLLKVVTRVSESSEGIEGNTNGVFRLTSSFAPSISGNGRHVVFSSYASNLVSSDTQQCQHLTRQINCADVFVHDRETRTTVMASVSSAGEQASDHSFVTSPNAVSADGRTISFESYASDLVSNDMNGSPDVFVRNVITEVTEIASVSSTEQEGLGWSQSGAVSADGRFVVFQSRAFNLTAGDTNGAADIFIRDRGAGLTVRVSVSSAGLEGDGASSRPTISADGRHVGFESLAQNLVSGDTNSVRDIFVRNRGACASGEFEGGPVSDPVHSVGEPLGGPAASTLHEVSCELLVPQRL